ncbi:MAG TPA: TonB-dependent receptor [Luteimonas sp.]|nr:TonB-dependent receptor [Luteimonas sp.]
MPISLFAMPRASRLALALACAAAPCFPAFAADAPAAPAAATTNAADDDVPVDLGRVVVRGKRFPANTVEDIDQARERLDERAGATALVDGDSYRDGRVGNLADALGQAPGVFVQPRFGAEEARLSIRGSGLQRTFHGRGIVVLQDGVPLNLADGSFDFQAIEPLAARYIRVWRGANALEAGAATLGGAIDFVSPTGYDAPALEARLEGGSFGTQRAQAALAGAGEHADGYLGLTSARQDGFRAHAQQENTRLFGNAGFRFGEALDARLYLARVDTRSELPGNLTLAEALDDPALAAPASIAQDQRRDFRLDRIAGKLAWSPVEGGSATLSLFHSAKSLHHPIFQVLDQQSRDDGVDLRWRGESTLGGRRNVLAAGLAYARGSLDDVRHANVGGERGAPTNHFDQHAANASAFVEDQAWLAPRWVLVLGAQAVRSTRRSRDLQVDGGRDESFDAAYASFSPRIGLRFDADPRTQWFANLSRSAEPPSFGELSGGPGVTPVGQQRAGSAELGMRTQRDALSLDVAVYRARIRGELLALDDAAGNPLGTVNAGRTVHQGVELGAEWTFARDWRLAANYLRNDFRFDRDPVYGDNALAGVPPQQLRASLRWQLGPHFHVEPNLEWVPQDWYVDHANTFRAPGYVIAGLKLGGEAGGGWRWFADLRNLGDRRWIAGTNVVADAGGGDGRNFLPGDGRSLYLGLEWRM